MTFKDRLIEFLKHIGIGQTNFESITGLGRASISKIKDGMSSPNLAKIAKAYPGLNINWLITGDGEMLKADDIPKIETSANNDSLVEYLKDKIEELEKENKRLIDTNGYYRGLLDKNGIDYKQVAS